MTSKEKQKKTSSCDLGAIFSKDVGRHFCLYFKGVCPDFQGSSPNQNFGGVLAPQPPTPMF